MNFIGGKRLDILVLVGFLLLGGFYAYITKDLFIGKALFVGAAFTVPAIIYLGVRKKKNWKKILVSTIVFGGIFAFVLDFIAEYSRTWTVVSLIFPNKILGVEPIDNILGYMLMTALTVVFYEHFVDREKNHHISKHLKFAVLPGIAAIFALFLIFLYKPVLLDAKYPYLIMGVAAIIPPVAIGFVNPNLIKKMAITSIYFFFLYFTYEFFAVSYRYWIYEGNNYLGWITFLNVRFPFEELFFWMMFYTACLVSYYELFIDDIS